jgi:cytochrome b involved in lipid metabolism
MDENENIDVVQTEEPTVTTTKPKSKFLLIGVLLVAVIIGFLFFNKKELRPIALDEISMHNSKESCWTAINGGVYDVTKFISSHKGGDKILNACGVDATDFFTGKHPTIGRVHSEMATKLLGGMKIGNLQ